MKACPLAAGPGGGPGSPGARTFSPGQLLPLGLGLVGLAVCAVTGHGRGGLRGWAGVAAVLLFDGGGVRDGALVAVVVCMGGTDTGDVPQCLQQDTPQERRWLTHPGSWHPRPSLMAHPVRRRGLGAWFGWSPWAPRGGSQPQMVAWHDLHLWGTSEASIWVGKPGILGPRL